MAAPLILAGALAGLGATAASATTCQARTPGQQPPSPDTVLGGVAVLSVCDVRAVGTSHGNHYEWKF